MKQSEPREEGGRGRGRGGRGGRGGGRVGLLLQVLRYSFPATVTYAGIYILDSGHTGQLETDDPDEEDGLNEGMTLT